MTSKYTNYEQDELIWDHAQFPNKVAIDEDIMLITRRDFSVIALQFISYFLVFILLLTFRIFLIGFFGQGWLGVYDFMTYTVNAFMIVSFAIGFHNYYLSMEILTNYRIIDIDQKGVFKREINQLSLDKIEDVSFKQNGIAQLIFNYGNVIVQTSGTAAINSIDDERMSGFVFNEVPHPKEVSNFVSKLYQEHKEISKRQAAELAAIEMNRISKNNSKPNF